MSTTMQSEQIQADAIVAPLVDGVVEQVCRDLKGRVARTRVNEVANALMARYPAPVVTAYIPIILRRLVREQFEVELHQGHDRRVVHERLREELQRRDLARTRN